MPYNDSFPFWDYIMSQVSKSFCENHPLGADNFSVGDEGVEVHA